MDTGRVIDEDVDPAVIMNTYIQDDVAARAKAGTYDLGDPWVPGDRCLLDGDSRERTVFRPADAGVNPVIDISKFQGSITDRQEKVTLRNFKIDSRDFALSDCIRHYNLKDSLFQDLWLHSFKQDGFFQRATLQKFSFWNRYQNLFFSADSARACFMLWLFSLDSTMDHVIAQINNTIGIYAFDMKNWLCRDFHGVNATNLVNLHPNHPDGDGGEVFNNRFIDFTADTCISHPFKFDRTNNTLKDIQIIRPFFIKTPNNMNIFDFTIPAGQYIDRVTIRDSTIADAGPNAHEYIVAANRLNLRDFLFVGNRLPIGDTGDYLNVQPGFITNDLVRDGGYMVTGTYEGDGTLGLAIVGLGFAPKNVAIWVRLEGFSDWADKWERTPDFYADNSFMHISLGSGGGHRNQVNALISLDVDGFTVDDGGVDNNPNKDGQLYYYLAIG